MTRNTYDAAGQFTHMRNGSESTSMTYADDGQPLSESDSERETCHHEDDGYATGWSWRGSWICSRVGPVRSL